MATPASDSDGVLDVFVLGLDDRHHELLRTLGGADRCRFHQLFATSEIRGVDTFSVESWLDAADATLAARGGAGDGLVNYWDFPITEMAAILADRHGLPAASLEAVTRLQHKYWARLRQQEVVPGHVPAFRPVDVFDDAAIAAIDLPRPFWLKPVRSFRSHLGFRIRTARDLRAAVTSTREELPRLADPYGQILDRLSLPAEVAAVGARACVAEAIVSGRQCTLEGWSHDGEVEVYGAVDSIRAPNRSSFARYQYPSRLPAPVLERMAEVARAVVVDAGYEHAAFNAEFFWETARDRIWLLEINARTSQSHFELFDRVDGVAHAQVLLDLALDRRPEMPHRGGEWPIAGKCFIRAYRDGHVSGVPDPEAIAAIEAEVPGTNIHLDVQAGQRLSDLPDQDAYSYELGHVIVGATSQRDLLARFRRCVDRLALDIDERSP